MSYVVFLSARATVTPTDNHAPIPKINAYSLIEKTDDTVTTKTRMGNAHPSFDIL
jgi:hypothetical protein